MTTTQRIIKYFAIAIAVSLIVSIFSAMITGFNIIGSFFANENPSNLKELNLESGASILEIDLKASSLKIVHGDEFKAETDNEYIQIEKNSNKLIIKEQKRNLFGDNKLKHLTVYIPNSFSLDAVEIANGAGNMEIETLTTDYFYLNVGAGNVEINDISVNSKSVIDGGVGKFTIKNGDIKNLDLDLGIGDVEINSALKGKIEIDNGIGSTEIYIAGKKDDFEIEVDKGIGQVLIDGTSVKNGYNTSGGTHSLDISGGIGTIKVNFGG